MRRLIRAFDRWAFEAWTPASGDLAVYRIAFALFLIACWLPRGLWTSQVPSFAFSPPPGTPALFPGLPSGWFMAAVNVGAIASALALLFGWRTRIASLAVAIFLLAVESSVHTTEVSDHTSILIVVPALLAFSSWGEAHSIDARLGARRTDGQRDAWLLALLALLLGSAWFTAGFEKASTRWLDPSRHASYGHLVRTWFESDRGTPLTPWLISLDAPFFWKGMDYATLALEIGFLPAVLFPRVFRLFLAVACCFHLGVYLLFHISITQTVAAYGAFVPWSALSVPVPLRSAFGRAWRTLAAASPAWVLCGGFALGVLAVLLTGRSPERGLWKQATDWAVLAAAAIAGAVHIARALSPRRASEAP